MASQKEIESYSVLHYRDGTSRINLHFADDTYEHYDAIDAARATLLLDILRNEHPVYWTAEQEILWTGKEPVGEGERR